MRGSSTDERGQALVELALLLPLYAILLATVLWMDRFGAARLEMELAARRAAWHAPPWRADPGGAEAAALRRWEDVRGVELSCRHAGGGGAAARGIGMLAGGGLLETREGTARIEASPLPYPYPGRGLLHPEARFVVDMPAVSRGGVRRILSALGIGAPPSLPSVR